MMRTLSRNIFTGVFSLLLTFSAFAQNKPVSSSTPSATSELSTVVLNPLQKVNYFRAFSFQKPMTNLNQLSAEITADNVRKVTEYSDGLGRPIQTVSYRNLPGHVDLVSMTLYDAYGRQQYSPLAFGASSTNGGIQLSPISQLTNFQSSLHPGESIFYSKEYFDASPLNQVRKTVGPGNSWAYLNSGITNAVRPNNSADKVKLLAIGLSSSNQLAVDGDYASGTLMVNITVDENGYETREFFNRKGEVVLRRTQISSSTPTVGSGSEWLSIYYVHDQKGLLRRVIPPKATAILEDPVNNWSNLAEAEELVFKYNFDVQSRLIEKKIPGAEKVTMVYDRLDRLVLSQTGNQLNSEWTFTKYDDLDRPIMSGFIETTKTRQQLQDDADAFPIVNVTREALDTENVLEGHSIAISKHVPGTVKYRSTTIIEFLPGFECSSDEEEFVTEINSYLSSDFTHVQGYHDASFPKLKDFSFETIALNYFDNYQFTELIWDTNFSGFYANGGINNAETPLSHLESRGLETGARIKVLGSNDEWLTKINFYDDHDRLTQTTTENHLGGRNTTTTQYDFGGKVLHTYQRVTNPQSTQAPETAVLKRFAYDHGDRLLSIEQKINDSGSFKTFVSNSYNSFGKLSTKTLGNSLESIEYDYNTRGWLEALNKDYLEDGTGGHYFGMSLSYARGFEKNRLNGDISGIKWRTRSSPKTRAYGFEYDGVNRLTQAHYSQWETDNWNNSNKDFSTAYSYDENGNLSSLRREGMVVGSKVTLDHLSYGYFNSNKSNQLTNVTEQADFYMQGDFRDGTHSGADYFYDLNGNMTQDQNKGIQPGDIKYNHLNLPEQLIFGGNSAKTINFLYDATGNRLRKTVNEEGEISITDYINGFVYENDELRFFAHEEGRTRPNAGSFEYDYYVKDHLGNTRLTLTEETRLPAIYLATMESSVREFETSDSQGLGFGHISTSNTEQNANANHTVDIHNEFTSPAPNMALRTNGSYEHLRLGATKMLKVMTGDQVYVEAYAHYNSSAPLDNGGASLGITASLLSGAFGGVSGASGTEGAIHDLFSNQFSAISAAWGSPNPSDPKAYLNWILFDDDFNVVANGTDFDQVSSVATSTSDELLSSPIINVTASGYFYVYVSNESTTTVFFDDVRIEHTPGQILQEDHYYPFGLTISDLSSVAPQGSPNTINTFQGQEKVNDLDLGWMQFKWRNHDPTIGRFFNVDPLSSDYAHFSPYTFSGNLVTNNNELEGLEPTIPAYQWSSSEGYRNYGDYYRNGGNVQKVQGYWVLGRTIDNDFNYNYVYFNESTNSWQAFTPAVPESIADDVSRVAYTAIGIAASGVGGAVLAGDGVIGYLLKEGAEFAVEEIFAIPYVPINPDPSDVLDPIVHYYRKTAKSRLPRSNGLWEGTPGKSKWKSSIDEVNEITGGKGIPFKNGYPDFSEWSVLDLKYDKLTGVNASDFALVHRDLMKRYGFKSQKEAANWLKSQGLTLHHLEDGLTIQLVPSNLHNNIPHIGGASVLRNK